MIGQEHGHLHNEMEGAVAVFLGMLDVVLFRDEGDIILTEEGVGDEVDIVDVGANDTDPRHIVDVLLNGFQGEGQALSLQLVHDAFGALQTGGNGGDGIAVVFQLELGVQHFKFGLDLLEGAGVEHLQFFILHHGPHHGLGAIVKGVHDGALAEQIHQLLGGNGGEIGILRHGSLLSVGV